MEHGLWFRIQLTNERTRNQKRTRTGLRKRRASGRGKRFGHACSPKPGLVSVKSEIWSFHWDQSDWNETFSDYQSEINFSDVVERKPSHRPLVFQLRILEENFNKVLYLNLLIILPVPGQKVPGSLTSSDLQPHFATPWGTFLLNE